MDITLLLKAIIIGIVEGLTEYLPVSSTGHMIVVSSLLNFPQDIAPTFEIVVQGGAVIALLLFFARDLIALLRRVPTDPNAQRLIVSIAIAFLPAAIIGLLTGKFIQAHLFSPVVVSLAMVVGGIALLVVERFVAGRQQVATVTNVERVDAPRALAVGLAQVLALIPGTSRSAPTIAGGLLSGLDRATALRFSFYLAIPTLGAATAFDLLTGLKSFPVAILPVLAVGTVAAFVSALAVIRLFLAFVARHDLRPFAWYRIIAGLILLGLIATRVITN